ncbi:MAG: WYL domain-containing protein, partial [Lachnospiraceae bacterium]|nr:WYL domain-containing protein [Lachnospiraceae bacterium]
NKLREGKVINKAEEAKTFEVDERSIQRDIDDIRTYLADAAAEEGGTGLTVEYDRAKKGYYLVGDDGSMMTNEEILVVSKILLSSRAFTKSEMNTIIKKLIAGCAPLENYKLVNDLILNEQHHYIEPKHKTKVKEKIWELGKYIENKEVLEISYKRHINVMDEVKRTIIPVSIMFSDYYFYLNAYILEKNENQSGANKYKKAFDYPAIFRVDRIKRCKPLNEKYIIKYSDRFEEGLYRKRIQFMFAGELVKVRLKVHERALEATLDRLPTARVILEKKDANIVEAEVYGDGIIMWVLSQGEKVEIIYPEKLREKIKGKIESMWERYK